MDELILGVDIGGSHLAAALVDLGTMSVFPDSHLRKPVNSKASGTEIITQWATAIRELMARFALHQVRIGVAMPGPFDYENGISLIRNLNKYDALYQWNVKARLAEALSIDVTNIRLMNDAAAFLRGEVYFGAARGYAHAIGVTLGTGTGTATHHHPITRDANLGPSPYLDSIADEYFSTRWFVRSYFECSGKIAEDVRTIAALYESEQSVREIFKKFAGNLAHFLEAFRSQENPDVIILGGNISRRADLFLPEIQKLFLEKEIATPILLAQLGEEAAVLGAASLFE